MKSPGPAPAGTAVPAGAFAQDRGGPVAIIPGSLPAGSLRPDLAAIPLHGVEPGHVVLATRAGDRSRLVAAFRRSAQDCLASAVPTEEQPGE